MLYSILLLLFLSLTAISMLHVFYPLETNDTVENGTILYHGSYTLTKGIIPNGPAFFAVNDPEGRKAQGYGTSVHHFQLKQSINVFNCNYDFKLLEVLLANRLSLLPIYKRLYYNTILLFGQMIDPYISAKIEELLGDDHKSLNMRGRVEAEANKIQLYNELNINKTERFELFASQKKEGTLSHLMDSMVVGAYTAHGSDTYPMLCDAYPAIDGYKNCKAPEIIICKPSKVLEWKETRKTRWIETKLDTKHSKSIKEIRRRLTSHISPRRYFNKNGIVSPKLLEQV